MAIFDQMELFKNSDFSGSYTDRIFRGPEPIMSTSNGGLQFGQVLEKDWFQIKPPVQNFFGEPCYSRAGNITGSLIPENTEDDTNLLFLEQRLELVRGKRAGKNNLFNPIFDDSEIFIDSILPSPLEIQIFNSGNFAVVNGQADNDGGPTWSALYDEKKRKIGIFPNGKIAVMFVGTSFLGEIVTTSSFDSNFSIVEKIGLPDNIWNSTYPFEKRYSKLTRYRNPTLSVEQIGEQGLRARFAYDGSGSGVGGSKDLLAQTVTNYGGISPNYNRVFERIVAISFLRCLFINQFSDGGDGFVSSYEFEGFGQLIAYNNFFDNNTQSEIPAQPQPATLEENFKLYFGFGTGERKIGLSPPTGPTSPILVEKNYYHNIGGFLTQDFGSSQRSSFLGISGYKYGIINHSPLSTKLLFRRGRYGQFRDLLEQRLFSKMYDNEREEPLEAVAVARFLPGTEADIVSKTGYISTEPGYFNREYQSVKPFADDVFPTFIEEAPLNNELVIV